MGRKVIWEGVWSIRERWGDSNSGLYGKRERRRKVWEMGKRGGGNSPHSADPRGGDRFKSCLWGVA